MQYGFYRSIVGQCQGKRLEKHYWNCRTIWIARALRCVFPGGHPTRFELISKLIPVLMEERVVSPPELLQLVGHGRGRALSGVYWYAVR